MNTWDKMYAAVAALADTAVETTGKLAEKGKKQVTLVNLENQLSRAQRQLGALVYALRKNGDENEALVQRYVDAIARVEAQIDALEGMAEEPVLPQTAEDEVYCPQCGAPVDPNAVFCPACGGKL